MIDAAIRYLVVSSDPSLTESLTQYFGDALHCCTDVDSVDDHIMNIWPQAIIVDLGSIAADAGWFYQLRQRYPIAETPLVLIQKEANTDLEAQLSHLNRLSLVDTRDVESVTTFVDILVDAYVRDPFYERQPQLSTLEHMIQMWRNHQCGKIYYSRYDDNFSPEEGHCVHIVHGGVRSPLALASLEQLLRDPRPTFYLEENSQYLGDWLSVGEMLFEALKSTVRPGFLRIRQWYALVPNPDFGAIAKDLPISLETRRIIQQDHSWIERSIHDRMMALEIRSTQIEVDIEILVRLGLYQLNATTLQGEVTTSQTSVDLPRLPLEQWPAFLNQAMQEQMLRFQMPNPWIAWGWKPQHSLVEQAAQTKARWSVFEMLPHIDAQHTNRQLHDALDALVRRLLPWQHAYLVLGRPDKDEDTQLWLAIHHLETLNPTAAQQALKDCTHPLPRAIFLWLEARTVLDQPSLLRPILIELDMIVRKGPLPLFEAYMATIQMAMGHWSQAMRRLKSLPSTHQTRSLLWQCQQRTLDTSCWVFWQI